MLGGLGGRGDGGYKDPDDGGGNVRGGVEGGGRIYVSRMIAPARGFARLT